MTTPATLSFETKDDLRQYLDDLNEEGLHPIAVGLHGNGYPFLITLVGPYVEGEDVIFDSPWQGDIDYGKQVDGAWVPKEPRCDNCMAMVHGIEDLTFPVTVFATMGFEMPLGPHHPACVTYGDDSQCTRCNR